MFSTLRTRFGIPGVISVMALVFAMFGGAYAASNSSDGGKATASAKAKKGPRGPKGPKGDTGPAGPAGPAGANGKDGANGLNGEDGAKGDKGATGNNGAPGTSVTATDEATGTGNCEGRGGSKFAVGAGTPTYACNGKQGIQGDDGETGFTETLPPGKTETGAWAVGAVTPVTCTVPEAECDAEAFAANEAPTMDSISFTIPLEGGLDEAHVHYVKSSGPNPAECDGSVTEPEAAPGHLCVYAGAERFFGELAEFAFMSIQSPAGTGVGATAAGAAIFLLYGGTDPSQGQGSHAYGTWAVTAPIPTP